MSIICFGSLNVDVVYRVPHIVPAGETLAAKSVSRSPGGKGANQAVAAARALGLPSTTARDHAPTVHMAGRIGEDGRWLLDALREHGVDPQRVEVDSEHPTGHAIIQVDAEGQNAIVVYGGANQKISLRQTGAIFQNAKADDWLMVQNEVAAVPAAVATARSLGMKVCFNPAPMNERALAVELAGIDLIVVNQIEAQAMTTSEAPDTAIRVLQKKSGGTVILTLGELGALHFDGTNMSKCAPEKIFTEDTTAAGDTFIGYFVAGLTKGFPLAANLDRATRAAALCCSKPGAMEAIPTAFEVDGGD